MEAKANVSPITVAIVTTGRIAPSLSPAVGFFIRRYAELATGRNAVRLIAYRYGFRGVLQGDFFEIGDKERAAVGILIGKGGSPIGGSRARLSNTEHLLLRGLIKDGEDPFERCAAKLCENEVDVIHVIGSGSAHSAAGKIVAACLHKYGRHVRAVGLPKTIENDMTPIRYTLGAMTAAEQGAIYFNNIVPEHNANPRMLIIHEIKGMAAGWLTAATARQYRMLLDNQRFSSPEMGLARENFEIHAIYTPEMDIDFDSEIERLRRCMDRNGNVNVFVAQGTLNEEIAQEAIAKGAPLQRHSVLKYTLTETGAWFSQKLKTGLGAEKVLVQKSGIFVRAAACGDRDKMLIQGMVDFAVEAALHPNADASRLDQSSAVVVGHDEEHGGLLSLIDVSRLSGKKRFNLNTPWFVAMLAAIGQPQPVLVNQRKAPHQVPRNAASVSKL